MEMIGVEESKNLFSLLTEESRPFDEIYTDFSLQFERRGAPFKICCALTKLLEEKILKPSERLIAFSILHQNYSSQAPASNPFISFLIDAACDDKAEHLEKAFIQLLIGSICSNNFEEAACDDKAEHLEKAFIQLLIGSICSNNFEEVLKLSAEDYMKVFDSSSYVLLPREELNKQHGRRIPTEPYNTEFSSAAIKKFVSDPDMVSIGHEDRGAAITGLLQNLHLEGLRPQLLRPFPPRLPVLDGELIWLYPANDHEILWDHGMCVDPRREAAFRDLIGEALKSPLKPAQEKQVLAELSNDPRLVERCGIASQNLPELIKNNSIVAVEILKKLKGSDRISEYLLVLVNMDMSLQTMEVVSSVMTAVEFPKEFVHVFIKNCISSCENIEVKFARNAVARIVCTLLEKHIRNKTMNVQDVVSELQTFCAKFSHIPAASSLLKILQ